jgi:dolichol-phosphate mannosyltransferase
MPSVSIIVPTLNEVENVEELLRRIAVGNSSILKDLEVVIVDDASTDGTADLVERIQADLPVRLLRRVGKQGLASAIIDGARIATGEIALVMDADLSHPPEAIAELVAPLLGGDCDMAIGSRYIPGASTPGTPLLRKLTSRTATLLAWPLCDVKDPMSGFFAVRRDRILQLQEDFSGFKIGMELLAVGGDSLKVKEVPIEFRVRRRGTSKLGVRVISDYLLQLLKWAGGNVTPANGLRFAFIGLLGLVTDFSVFELLFLNGVTLAAAHITSFLAATLVIYALNRGRSRSHERHRGAQPGPGRCGSFLLIALLAVLMRGGVLATLTQYGNWPVHTAILGAIAAGAVFKYIGFAFILFPQNINGDHARVPWRTIAIGAIAYSLLLRWFYLGVPELIHEEAYYWNYAQHLDIGYLDHPPMVAWIIHLGTMLFGDTEFGVRIGAFVCWLATAFFSYKLTYRIFEKTVAINAVMLIATLPAFFGVGLLMTPDASLVACWSATLYFLHRVLIDEERLAWIGVGICLGLGMLSKYSIALLGPALLVFMIVDPGARRWFLKPDPYLAAGICLALFSPVIVWNVNNEWASFLFQTQKRVTGGVHFSLDELVGSILVLMTPTGFAAAFAVIFFRKACRSHFCRNPGGSIGRSYTFGLVFLIVPLSVFLTFSLFRSIRLNWTGPLWLSLIPFIAFYLAPETAMLPQRVFRQIRRAWPATLAVCLMIYGGFLHYISLRFPGIGYPDHFPIVGGRDLGQQIGMMADNLKSASGLEPLVVGMDRYRISSLLAFYRPEKTPSGSSSHRKSVFLTAGTDLFGGSSLMYEYWFAGKPVDKRLMILVSNKRSYLEGIDVRSRFRRMEEIQQIVVRKNGKAVDTYFYAVAHGYN